MSIKNSIANITEKFMDSARKNIVYHKADNCFDICMQELPHNIINPKNNKLHIQYNLMLFNSIISLATNSLLENAGCFVHSGKPTNLKREDSFLLRQRTKNIHKIIFNPYLSNSWGFVDKAHVLPYGIPSAFKKTNTHQRNKIGIFNLQNSVDVSNVANHLRHNNTTETIEITKLDNIVDVLNQCSLVIEMYEHNVINSLCSIKCGCVALMPNSDYINNCYEEIVGFNDIQHLIDIVKNNHKKTQNDISSKYEFENFVDKMNNVLSLINNEVFVL